MAKRILRNPEKSFSKFIVRLAIGATSISVAIMIIAISFLNGFQKEISSKVFAFWGHIKVQSELKNVVTTEQESIMIQSEEVDDLLKSNKEISQFHCFATKTVLLKYENNIESIVLKGMNAQLDFANIQNFLVGGRWYNKSDSIYTKEIVLSQYVAKRLNIKVGDSLGAYFKNESETEIVPKFRKLIVVGIYKTGIEDYDKNIGLCSISLIRKLNNWQNNEIGGYEIYLKNINNLTNISNEINENLPQHYYTKTTKDLNPTIFDWLNLQGKITQYLIVILTIVAIVNLITCLIILLLERRKMIAILKTTGAENMLLQKVFLIKGLYISLQGIFLGVAIGLFFCFLQNEFGFIKLKEEAYFITKAVAVLNPIQIITIISITFLASMAMLFIPTFFIKKIDPISLLKFE